MKRHPLRAGLTFDTKWHKLRFVPFFFHATYGKAYVRTRLRPASMRRKMKSRMVKPHNEEPP